MIFPIPFGKVFVMCDGRRFSTSTIILNPFNSVLSPTRIIKHVLASFCVKKKMHGFLIKTPVDSLLIVSVFNKKHKKGESTDLFTSHKTLS